ncbi:MAG: hypothetical protein ACYDG0_08015 [Vulcanimicrobiaceae bacterium]
MAIRSIKALISSLFAVSMFVAPAVARHRTGFDSMAKRYINGMQQRALSQAALQSYRAGKDTGSGPEVVCESSSPTTKPGSTTS